MDKKYDDNILRAVEIVKNSNLMNDVFASIVLKDIPACQYVIKKILNRDDIKVIKAESQYRILNFTSKDSILDVLAEDSTGRLMNIEIQRRDTVDHARRTRYYSSMLDKISLDKGMEYSQMPDVYVIYISEEDLWDTGEAVCPVKKIMGKKSKPYDDGSYVVYVNAAVDDGTAAAQMMKYFKNAAPDDMSQGELSQRVNYLKSEKGGYDIMCKELEDLWAEALEKELEKNKEKFITIGKTKGKAEGKIEERFLSIKRIMKNMHCTLDEAMQALEIPAEERDMYLAMI